MSTRETRPDTPSHDPDGLRDFLARVASARDARLAEIEARLQSARDKARREAFARARALHREVATGARREADEAHRRSMSRLRAELRRARWAHLARAQDQTLARLHAMMAAAWAEPEAQWAWVRHWSGEAISRSGTAALSVCLGAGALETTGARLQGLLASREGDATVRRDEALGAGLTLAWSDLLLDARLASHVAARADTVHDALAGALHAFEPARAP